MSTCTVIDAFRDDASKRVFIRWTDGAISATPVTGFVMDAEVWFGDPDNIENSDPDGIVWAALTGQRASEAKISLENLQRREPRFVNLYDEDEPLSLANQQGAAAKIERIRDAARKVSITKGWVRDQHVAALLAEIFAP